MSEHKHGSALMERFRDLPKFSSAIRFDNSTEWNIFAYVPGWLIKPLRDFRALYSRLQR
jgi:hypothetical protein